MNNLPIDSALKDRIFTITVPGYNLKEKIKITSNYLLPKNLLNKGLKKNDITISDENASYLINTYTDCNNKGVRNVESCIKDIISKLHFIVNNPGFDISFMLKNKLEFPINLTKSMIDKFCKKKSTNPSVTAMYL